MISRNFLVGLTLIAVGLTLLITALLYNFNSNQRDSSQPSEGQIEMPTQPTASEPLEPGDFDPESSGEDYQTWVLEFGGRGDSGDNRSDVPENPSLAPGATPGATRALPRGSGGILFVVQDSSGRPQPGIRVQLKATNSGRTNQIMTGSRGEAVFRDLGPGPYEYLAEAPDGTKRISDSLRLEDAERKKLTLRLAESGLEITGRVRNQRGNPVAGISVTAERKRFASADHQSGALGASAKSVRTDESGAFSFRDLQEGEYQLLTRSTNRYLPARSVVQSGARSVELILVEGRRVAGTVTDSYGAPLERAWVGLDTRRDQSALTDSDGNYELWLEADLVKDAVNIRFYLRGYEVEVTPLPSRGLEGLRLDAQLNPVQDAASVSGTVVSERRDPIRGATIVLRSRVLGTQYQAVSDKDGAFSISAVKAGSDYSLKIFPNGPYLDFNQQKITISEKGLTLDLELTSLETGRLVGRMVDEQGNPIDDFRLWVAATNASQGAVPISSDRQGYFELSEAPAGSLSFDTRSSPRLTVRGVSLLAGDEMDVELVLDWGSDELIGHVVDERGDPIAGAEVSLSWSYTDADLRSTSQRSTRTDPNGSFSFRQLGPGEHFLKVTASGFRTVANRHNVGTDSNEIELRLDQVAQ